MIIILKTEGKNLKKLQYDKVFGFPQGENIDTQLFYIVRIKSQMFVVKIKKNY